MLQFVPVYVIVNQFCYIDTAPLNPQSALYLVSLTIKNKSM